VALITLLANMVLHTYVGWGAQNLSMHMRTGTYALCFFTQLKPFFNILALFVFEIFMVEELSQPHQYF